MGRTANRIPGPLRTLRTAMIRLNGSDYRLCLLDTNAVSELVKQQSFLRNFFKWAFDAAPVYLPSFTLFSVLELRRRPELYQQFLERFGPLPSMLLKSHEQLLEEETRNYPDPSEIDPALLGFSGELGPEGNQLAKFLPFAFSDEALVERERYWNEGEQAIVEGIVSLVPQLPAQQGRGVCRVRCPPFLTDGGASTALPARGGLRGKCSGGRTIRRH